jgi:protein-disulfide isomerase
MNETEQKEEIKIETQPKQGFTLTTPMALVVMGVLIAGAILIKAPSGTTNNAKVVGAPIQQEQVDTTNLEAMNPVTNQDHIRGNPNASVKIVEYSDTECPFCKRFHNTMQEVMKTYGDKGDVAWVYRHFPLDQLHSKARKEAEATECAGELGGNDKFWSYLDRLMEVTPANDGLDLAELPKIAEYVGLDKNKFNECLNSGKYAQKIEEHVQNAQATGGQGTPWSIIVSKSGKKYPLSGAQPISAIKQLVDIALKDK